MNEVNFLLRNRKTILLLSFGLGFTLTILIIWILFFKPQKTNLQSPSTISDTFIEYTDPAGFSFSYPDNLSLIKNEIEDDEIYADLQLNSNNVSGSLNLKITDSELNSLDEWEKLNTGTVKEVPLGNLKAKEIRLKDRLLLGALDQGIFFTIEMPLLEEDFWNKVYDQVLKSFSFETEESAIPTESIIFEGEEVVE